MYENLVMIHTSMPNMTVGKHEFQRATNLLLLTCKSQGLKTMAMLLVKVYV